MEQTKKRPVKKYVFLILVALLAVGLVVFPFVLDRISESGSDGASILSDTVRRGDVSRTVSGAGTIAAKDALDLTIPEGVVVTGYAVSNGDLVKEGDPVAYVDPISVYKTAAELGDTLADVTEELADLQVESQEGTIISSPAEAVVTKVYAQPGDSVVEIMNRCGALCELTQDDGVVLRISAVSGTVSWAYVQEGDNVYNGASLYSIYEMDSTIGYGSLVMKHQKIEKQMAQLFQMLHDGCAVATGDGMVTGLDETLVKKLSSEETGGLRATLLGYVDLSDPSDSTPTPSRTEYVSGTLTSALDADYQGTVSGINGTVDFSSFPDAKPGDTVFLRCDTYTQTGPDGTEEVSQIVYQVLLVSSSGQDAGGEGSPGGMDAGGGGGMSAGDGGGGMAAGGTASGETSGEFSLATTLVASVVPTDEVLVSVTIDELDILTLHVGDKAQVTIDALPGHSFEGVVTGVNTGRSNSGGNSKYTAEVTIPRSDDMLAGMNASCLVTIETLHDVLTVPAAAICDMAGGTVVYTGVEKDGFTLTAPVPVETGFSDGEKVEILSGLTEGDTIWYSTYDTPEYSVPSSNRGRGSVRLFGSGSGGPPV